MKPSKPATYPEILVRMEEHGSAISFRVKMQSAEYSTDLGALCGIGFFPAPSLTSSRIICAQGPGVCELKYEPPSEQSYLQDVEAGTKAARRLLDKLQATSPPRTFGEQVARLMVIAKCRVLLIGAVRDFGYPAGQGDRNGNYLYGDAKSDPLAPAFVREWLDKVIAKRTESEVARLKDSGHVIDE